MFKKKATLKDLARILELSPSTVSRALKDHPDISAETKRRTVELAKEMHFQPNPIAVSLRGQRSYTIGVIVPHFVHYFFSTVISGIEKVAQEKGYHVLVCSANGSHDREVSASMILLNQRVDGLLISIAQDPRNDHHFYEYRNAETPVVFFDCASNSFEADKVIIDDFGATKEAVDHLVEQGCRSIAYMGGPPSLLINQHRFSGYQQALKNAGLEPDPGLEYHGEHGSLEEGKQAAGHFFKHNQVPDGIFATTDLLAIGAIKQIKSLGLRVPQDVALVGFSNWEISEVYEPSLTTVRQPGREMGATAMNLLLERIEKGQGEYRTKILSTELLVRESSVRS